MTGENKENILNYITGNYEVENPSNDEVFLEQGLVNKNLWTDYIPEYSRFMFEGMIAPNENTTPLGVMYGGYIDNDNNVYGIIILINQDFQPVKTIYEYDSGTKLRYIQYMKQAEDGTFYFIDDIAYPQTQRQQVMTSQKRFVMVNNFTLKNQITNDYDIKLRTSYILGNNYKNFYCKNMYKDPNSSHYIFFGSAVDSNSAIYAYRYLKIWELKINVGSANEWKLYVNDQARLFGSAIATFENDNVRYRCLTSSSIASATNLVLYSKTYTGNPTSSNIITFSFHPYIDDNNYEKQSVFLDYDNVYFVQNNQHWGISGTPEAKYIGLYKYNISTSQLTTIYEKSLGNYDYCNLEAVYIDRCNTDIYVQFNDNVDSTGTISLADYYFQRLVNDTWNPIFVDTQKYFQYNYRSLFIKANYNLLQIYLYSVNTRIEDGWYYYSIKEDYNFLNYNSTAYNDYSSMIGTKGQVYSNGGIVFARNLYNRTSWNNTTTSTVQIPSGYLNNMTLQPKKLLSYSNSIINNDTEELTKNSYESVLLNFVNSINVIDDDTDVIYPATANYINTAINVGTQANSENIQISKVRINYENGSVIQPITWDDIVGENAKETSFSLYISSPLTSIDFLSDDESFIYLTKEYNDYTVGNIYTITQKIKVE